MIIAIIIFIGAFIIFGLIVGLTTDKSDDLGFIPFLGILTVIVFTIGVVVDINDPTTNKSSKTKITPELKIETKVINNEIVSVDTTYIYTFSN